MVYMPEYLTIITQIMHDTPNSNDTCCKRVIQVYEVKNCADAKKCHGHSHILKGWELTKLELFNNTTKLTASFSPFFFVLSNFICNFAADIYILHYDNRYDDKNDCRIFQDSTSLEGMALWFLLARRANQGQRC